jgi:APA family basic amino acid/polyamine antiporter
VAHGWSKYFQDLLKTIRIELPVAVRDAPLEYRAEFGKFVWTESYLDLPALLITAVITYVLVKGIRESARFNTVMVAVKVSVVLIVIGVGAMYVNPANWRPFAPFGYTGISIFGYPLLGQSGKVDTSTRRFRRARRTPFHPVAEGPRE